MGKSLKRINTKCFLQVLSTDYFCGKTSSLTGLNEAAKLSIDLKTL